MWEMVRKIHIIFFRSLAILCRCGSCWALGCWSLIGLTWIGKRGFMLRCNMWEGFFCGRCGRLVMSLLSRGSLLQTTRLRPGFIPCWSLWPWCLIVSLMVWSLMELVRKGRPLVCLCQRIKWLFMLIGVVVGNLALWFLVA